MAPPPAPPAAERARTVEAAIMRDAAMLIGTERLASSLGIEARTLQRWMVGERAPRDWASVLTPVRQLLIEHRQNVGTLISTIRAVQGIEP